MIKPEPVPPPALDSVAIETTDGKTRCAIPATESGFLSIVLVELTKLARYGIQPVDALEPNIPPITPAITATKSRFRFEELFFVEVSHQGRGAFTLFLRGNFIFEFCYTFVASNKPSPVGMRELTHSSPPALIIFPASRSATVFASLCAGS